MGQNLQQYSGDGTDQIETPWGWGETIQCYCENRDTQTGTTVTEAQYNYYRMYFCVICRQFHFHF